MPRGLDVNSMLLPLDLTNIKSSLNVISVLQCRTKCLITFGFQKYYMS